MIQLELFQPLTINFILFGNENWNTDTNMVLFRDIHRYIYASKHTGPRSAVSNVPGNRCESDCRSRGWRLIPARSHTFVEIDHEIISMVILLPSAESFKKGCCQLQAKVCARSTGKLVVQACPGKSVVRWIDRPAMTIAVDLGRKARKQKKCLKTLLNSLTLSLNFISK